MNSLKKVFLVCLFSFVCLGFVNVSAKEYTITYNHNSKNYKSFQMFLNEYPEWQNYDYVYNIAKNLADTKLSTKDYKMVFISWNSTTNSYFEYGSNKYGITFSIVGWNNMYDLYYQNNSAGLIPQYKSGSSYSHLYYLTENSAYYCSISPTGDIVGSCATSDVGYNSYLYGNFNAYDDLNLKYNYGGYYETLIYTNVDYTDEFKFNSTNSSSNSYILLPNGKKVGSNAEPLKFTDIYSDRFAYLYEAQKEPTYTYTSNVLENGNVELTFTFEDYDNANSLYAFTIENEVSGEEYGEENPFSSIFPKVIPYGNSYTITIPYDTYLYITLAKYNQLENSSLYSREEIFTDVIDINNIVFANPSTPYFSIDYQSKTFIQGRFNNTKTNDICYVKFSDDLTTRQVSCTDTFSVDYDFNGYLTFYVSRNNDIVYTRNVNVLGNNATDYPYLTYSIEKQDFYSVVTFNVINDNYDINMSYRYSLDNGVTWTDYQLIDITPPTFNINIFSNSNVIFEIANARDPDNIVFYDSKSVYVVIDISTASGLNSSTDNIIDKFISLISLNDNLINYINLSWNSIKNSKIFLPIMIHFISSIICAIIYLIRRK